MPMATGARRLKAEDVPVLHLQWLLPNRKPDEAGLVPRAANGIDGRKDRRRTSTGSTRITLPERYAPTAPVPPMWLDDVTLPGTSVDAEPSWHEAEILRWFDERGVAFFEPLEIWHVPLLRQEFRKRAGRNPRPDRSYLPSPIRPGANARAARLCSAAKRRIIP